MRVPRHRAGRHVVELDADAPPTEHPPCRRGIQRQGQRRAALLRRARPPARLVVDDDELVTDDARSFVEPVDPAGEDQRAGAQ
jgi:hypothetical protein